MTLLEILLAGVLFAIITTTLSAVWVLHARAQQKTGQLLVAADLADNEMNRVLGLGYHAVTSSLGTFSQVWEVRGQRIRHDFEVQTVVVPITLIDVKFIRVVVRYSDGSPTDKPSEYVTDCFIASDEL